MKIWIRSFFALFFPRCCVVCDGPLHATEHLCVSCNMHMPRTYYHLKKDNPAEKLFWGKIPLERATSYIHYHKGSAYRQVVHRLKYKGFRQIGRYIGSCAANELLDSCFFEGIDVIVPVPLHRKKQRKRGYNQSEWIALGIAEITGIPVECSFVTREIDTESQTSKSIFERWENVEGIFKLHDFDRFAGKHILIVDDILTTGSTLVAFASIFSGVKDLKISLFTLGIAD